MGIAVSKELRGTLRVREGLHRAALGARVRVRLNLYIRLVLRAAARAAATEIEYTEESLLRPHLECQ
jgi:hypothetical protein